MLFKCFKLVPVMIMGKFLGQRDYPLYEYGVAASVGVGIAIFIAGTEDLKVTWGQDAYGFSETPGATWTGILLLLLFLVFDSFTGQWQSRMFQRQPDISPFHMMFAVNTFSMIFSLITLVHTHEFEPACSFVYSHPQMHFHLIVFTVTATLGQLFIFQTIKNFGAVVFAITMNTRIILSILLSCFIYNHDVGASGYLGLFIVFSSIAYRIKRKMQGTRLVTWRVDSEKEMEVFHEWHVHCDM